MAVHPGPAKLGVLNVRLIRNKGFLAKTTAKHDFDFICLTQTHIQPSDTEGFL